MSEPTQSGAPWGDPQARDTFTTDILPEAVETYVADHASVSDLICYNLFLSLGILTEEQFGDFATLYGVGKDEKPKIMATMRRHITRGLLVRRELPVPCVVMPGSVRAILKLCLPEKAWALDLLPNAQTDCGASMQVAAMGRHILRNSRVLHYLVSIRRNASDRFRDVAASVQLAMTLAQVDFLWKGETIACALTGLEQSPARTMLDRRQMSAAILGDWERRTGSREGLAAHGGGLLGTDGRLKPMEEWALSPAGGSQKRILDRTVAREIGTLIAFSQVPAGCILAFSKDADVLPDLSGQPDAGVPVYAFMRGRALRWRDGRWSDEEGRPLA